MEDNQTDPQANEKDAANILTRLLTQQTKREEVKEALINDIREWKAVLNRIFSSEDGHLLATYMLRHNKLFNVDSNDNPATLLRFSGRKQFYVDLIRPYLDPAILAEIESPSNLKPKVEEKK